MSDLPTYEKLDPAARLATDDELERQPLVEHEPSDAASPTDIDIEPPPPLPWAEGETRHSVTFRFVPPNRLRALGGDCVGVLGRSKEVRLSSLHSLPPTSPTISLARLD